MYSTSCAEQHELMSDEEKSLWGPHVRKDPHSQRGIRGTETGLYRINSSLKRNDKGVLPCLTFILNLAVKLPCSKRMFIADLLRTYLYPDTEVIDYRLLLGFQRPLSCLAISLSSVCSPKHYQSHQPPPSYGDIRDCHRAADAHTTRVR
jgi:hypothetical protein